MKLTGLKGRIPVAPLDDERLTNIERRIVTGAADAAARDVMAPAMRAPRFGLAMAFALTVVVAIGAGFAGWQLRGEGSRTVVAAEPVRVNTAGERSLLDIGDAHIESDLQTDFTVTRPDGGVLITLERGKVELSVDKRGNRAPLVVAAGDTRVTVVGTRFSVDFGDGTNGVDVRVTEGVVKVERHQQEVRVAAGQAWTTKRGVIALATLVEEDGPAQIASGPDVGGARIGEDDARTDDQIANAIDIDTSTPDVLRDRTATVPDAKLPAANHGAGPKPIGKPEVNRPPGGGGSAATSAVMDLRSLVRSQPVLDPLDLGVKPTESIALYRKITVEEKGEKAALAMYSIAVQQHLKLGRNGDALTTLDQYVRRFAGTQYKTTYHAALWLRVRILCAKNIDDRCRQAAYTFMRKAQGTPAAKVAEALTLSPR